MGCGRAVLNVRWYRVGATMMTPQQRTAIEQHCRLSIETMRPEFAWAVPAAGVTVVLTVNSGYE